MAKCRVAILGGSGYGGSELLRILLFHPRVEVGLAAANRWAGRPVVEAHPNLAGLTDLVFSSIEEGSQLQGFDCVFLALPHGESSRLVPRIPEGVRVIDLAGDFRLEDPSEFEASYGFAHPCFELQRQFTYGLPEIFREGIRTAQRVANPGCFATALLLGMYPLVASDLVDSKVVIDAKTGSSGSGSTPGPGTHHPVRSHSFYAYKSFRHQHLPEVLQAIREVRPGWDVPVVFQAHSAPLVRGIFASIYCSLKRAFTAEEIELVYRQAYAGSFFVRLVPVTNVAWVQLTNFADISWAVQGQELAVFVAIDNLVKGAAGQAVQNMNLMFGFEESAGLVTAGGHP